MTVFWEQFLFSSRTRFNLLLQFYHRLLAHLPVLLLLSQLLPQFFMTNLRWLAMVKELFNLVVVVVTFVMRLKPLLLLTDSLSKGSALLNNRFVLSTFSSTLSPFVLSSSLPTVRFWSPVVQTNASDCGTSAKSLAAMSIHIQSKWKRSTVTVALLVWLSAQTTAISSVVVHGTRQTHSRHRNVSHLFFYILKCSSSSKSQSAILISSCSPY